MFVRLVATIYNKLESIKNLLGKKYISLATWGTSRSTESSWHATHFPGFVYSITMLLVIRSLCNFRMFDRFHSIRTYASALDRNYNEFVEKRKKQNKTKPKTKYRRTVWWTACGMHLLSIVHVQMACILSQQSRCQDIIDIDFVLLLWTPQTNGIHDTQLKFRLKA